MALPVDLEKEIIEDNVVLFVGAGFVRNYLPNMPSWLELLKKVYVNLVGSADGIYDYCAPLFDGSRNKIIPPSEYLKLAQKFELVRKEMNKDHEQKGKAPIPSIHHLIQKQILDAYDREEAKKSIQGTNLCKAKKLPFSGWVTTNYDTFLEDSFLEDGIRSGKDLVVDRPVRNIDFRPNADGRFLLKIHGSVSALNPDTSIVITEDDYHQFLRQDRYLVNKLHTLFCERTVVFLGYGLNDPNIQFIYNEVLFDQKRAGGEDARSFLQIRPAYFLSPEVISEGEKAYFLHKKIVYVDNCPIEDFFKKAISAYEIASKTRKDIRERIEHNVAVVKAFVEEMRETDPVELAKRYSHSKLTFERNYFGLVELFQTHYAPSVAIGERYSPVDHNSLVRAIHSAGAVVCLWVEEDLKSGKLDKIVQFLEFVGQKAFRYKNWILEGAIEKTERWVLAHNSLPDFDRIAQKYCDLLFRYDSAASDWPNYTYCLKRYVYATNIFERIDRARQNQIVKGISKYLLMCGRDPGDSWYTTEEVPQMWKQFNPKVWSALQENVERMGVQLEKERYLPPKAKMILDCLAPGKNFEQFYPKK